MGLIRGNLTLSRYAVAGETPADFWDWVDRRVRHNAFQSIEDTADELAVGWTSADDYLDTEFAFASYAYDPYVVLGLRLDRRRLPGPVLKKYTRMEVAKARQWREDGRLSRAEREELKEKVRLQLMRRLPLATQLVEVCWDTHRGEVWLASATKAVLEQFETLFRRTFELSLVPRIPWLLARDLAAGPEALRDLDAARPLELKMQG